MVADLFPCALDALLMGESCELLLIWNNKADNIVLVTGGQKNRQQVKTQYIYCFKSSTFFSHFMVRPSQATNLFAYAQMLSMRGQFFNADSTLPRETYSPA